MSDRKHPRRYSEKGDYLRAMSERLTPDLWDAVVTRAIHDATVGRPQARAKAREWLAKYVLPQKLDIHLTGHVTQEGIAMRVRDMRSEEEYEPYARDLKEGRRELLYSEEEGYYFTEIKEPEENAAAAAITVPNSSER